MSEIEEQIRIEARTHLPMEIKFAVDDPTRVQMELHEQDLIIRAVPGFLLDRLKRPEIRNVFSESVQKIAERAVAVSVEEMPCDSRNLDMLNLKFNYPGLASGKLNYHDWMNSDGWRKKRNRKLKEAGYKCELCGSAKNLRVHHITYENLGHEPMDDLLAVCDNCHRKLHKEDLKKKGGS